MLFNSFEFAAFYGVVLAVFYAARTWTWRKVALVAASYAFYGSWNPVYIVLLLMTTALDYLIAHRVEAASDGQARKSWVALSIGLNLLVLGFFKYSEFLIDSINGVLTAAGLPVAPRYSASMIVPIGLSFYTFQSIAYVVDVYRREIPAARSWLDYMAFVSFFPLLAAGPIMRARELMPQFAVARPIPEIAAIGAGIYLLVLGLFQKVVMADNLAPLVNLVFATPKAFSTLDTWAAVYGFAFQIYFDFAGYSNMAMGVAALLGFNITRNFNMPYVAVGFSDFWRRWHISLSQWLRDYLYVPLGGNRFGRLLTLRNLMLTMLLGGLWHGASWTFVLWGGLHGLYLAIERLWSKRRRSDGGVDRAASGLGTLGGMVITFHLVCLGWVLFRVEGGVGNAVLMLTKMMRYDGASFSPTVIGNLPFVAIALLFLSGAWLFKAARGDWSPRPQHQAILLGLMLAALALVPGQSNAFIYFQF